MGGIIEFGIFLVLLALGFTAGTLNEMRHFRQLAQREQRLRGVRVCNLKRIAEPDTVAHSQMVMGSVVIATDYFKSFATALRNLVGGEAKAAEKLLNRARREALMRMVEQAHRLGADEVWNVRFEFCSISMMRGRQGAMQVEVLAWGTAVKRKA